MHTYNRCLYQSTHTIAEIVRPPPRAAPTSRGVPQGSGASWFRKQLLAESSDEDASSGHDDSFVGMSTTTPLPLRGRGVVGGGEDADLLRRGGGRRLAAKAAASPPKTGVGPRAEETVSTAVPVDYISGEEDSSDDSHEADYAFHRAMNKRRAQ